MATRNPKCNEPLLLGRQGWVTDPHRGVSGAKLTDAWRLEPGGVPSPCFALVDFDARMPEQVLGQ